MLYGQDILLHS